MLSSIDGFIQVRRIDSSMAPVQWAARLWHGSVKRAVRCAALRGADPGPPYPLKPHLRGWRIDAPIKSGAPSQAATAARSTNSSRPPERQNS